MEIHVIRLRVGENYTAEEITLARTTGRVDDRTCEMLTATEASKMSDPPTHTGDAEPVGAYTAHTNGGEGVGTIEIWAEVEGSNVERWWTVEVTEGSGE